MTKTRNQFPETIKAARAHDEAERNASDLLWALGDALRKECGEPTGVGTNTGSNDRLRQAQAALAAAGYAYSFSRLEQFRSIAHKFKDHRHLGSVSFDAHLAAGEPALLEQIITEADTGTKLTRDYVLTQKRIIHGRQDADATRKDRDEPHPALKLSEAVVALSQVPELIEQARAIIEQHAHRAWADEGIARLIEQCDDAFVGAQQCCELVGSILEGPDAEAA